MTPYILFGFLPLLIPLLFFVSSNLQSHLVQFVHCSVNSYTSATFYSADSNPYSFLSDGAMTTKSHHSVVVPSQTGTNATAQVVTVVWVNMVKFVG